MIRKIVLSCLLVFAGFVAGLVLTGRMRTAGDSSANAVADAPQASASATTAPQQVSNAAAGGPDFTRIAGRAVKGVANISSVQVVPRQQTPVEFTTRWKLPVAPLKPATRM